MEFINLPGIGGSGEDHWQSYWENADSRFSRFQPEDWDAPELDAWRGALDSAVDRASGPAVLVAHSLACLLVAHWAPRPTSKIAGAFLVSVPDPAAPPFPSAARSFSDVPEAPLPFPTLILSSNNDPYGGVEYAQRRAAQWRAELIEVGPLGHVNAASGLADWAQGRSLLKAFCAGLQPADRRV
jgi:uncharacterized protein